MKKIFNLMMVVAISAIVLQSCKSKPSEKDVQAVANDFLKAIVNEDYDKAKELGTDQTDEMIEQIKMFSSMIPDSLQGEMDSARAVAKNATISFGSTTFNEEGTEATVVFTSSENPGKEETIKIKKVEKEWLADMGGDMPAN